MSHLLSSNPTEPELIDNEEAVDLSPEQRYDAQVAAGEHRVRYEVRIGVFAGFVRYSCTCSWSRSTGIPCAHVVRVSTVFREKCHTHPNIRQYIGIRIALGTLFHPYWRRNENDWPLTEIVKHRERISRAWQDGTVKHEGNLDSAVRDIVFPNALDCGEHL